MGTHLDYAAIGRILKSSDLAVRINTLARQVADHAAANPEVLDEDAPVSVADYITDRAISVVAIAHPAGTAIQAKSGVLTKAAAAVGLEVRSK